MSLHEKQVRQFVIRVNPTSLSLSHESLSHESLSWKNPTMLSIASRSIKTPVLSALARPFTTAGPKATLPDLPYDYDALEPIISTEIMRLHHSKHHQAYINAFNQAEEKLDNALSKGDLTQQIQLQNIIKFNGGGHINHSLFWQNLAPKKQGGGEHPKGSLLSAIQKDFGSLDNFVTQFNTQTAAVQGSGWGWLVGYPLFWRGKWIGSRWVWRLLQWVANGYNKAAKRLEIATTANQDPLLNLTPLLGVDVWEHAYYLQYKNVRPDYLKAIWEVVNWKTVAERYAKAHLRISMLGGLFIHHPRAKELYKEPRP
ncbi:Manganese/iron superoxide dismutase [Jimgerdemannia flammicorona]|uniref:superoxide dismutase n=1 Tax=Jimgerdemannia flammicorona TaxID=994334 RepID=A0A433QIB3_9FUNG|nr:Manganese/iron superoxide dismutase [Jimgerdemannia flammicorona]